MFRIIAISRGKTRLFPVYKTAIRRAGVDSTDASGATTRTAPTDRMSAMENKQKHLEFIQAAVGRMASNLFLLKGWTITLIAALFALSAKESNVAYFYIAYLPAFLFWGLDGYFLSQERRFRSLYDHVRKLEEDEIDFSLDTEPFKKIFRNTWVGAMISRTILTYYLVLIGTMLIVIQLIKR
jgi:hypothetical protein